MSRNIKHYNWQFFVTFLGMVKWPVQRLSDLQLQEKKGHFESPGILSVVLWDVHVVHQIFIQTFLTNDSKNQVAGIYLLRKTWIWCFMMVGQETFFWWHSE